MACASANANDSYSEETMHQPLDQVSQVERDNHSLTVDSQDSGTTVVRLMSKKHQSNKENVLPGTSRATRSTQSPVDWPILSNLTTQKQQSRLDEIREEEFSTGLDDPMPQLISPTSSPRQHQQNHQESDDAVTMKTPRVPVQQESNLSEESTDEEIIKSDNDTVKSDKQASPQYTSASSEENEIERIKTTPSKGRNELRMSQSLIMDKSQVERALKTFSASKPLANLNNWEPSSERPSQASRINDSTQVTNSDQIKQGLNSKMSQPKKESAKIAARTNLDAESVNDANKPLARSRARILASQNSQANENNHPPTTSSDCIMSTHAPAPSGSRLTIKRFKDYLIFDSIFSFYLFISAFLFSSGIDKWVTLLPAFARFSTLIALILISLSFLRIKILIYTITFLLNFMTLP